jgi:hypothetical protein
MRLTANLTRTGMLLVARAAVLGATPPAPQHRFHPHGLSTHQQLDLATCTSSHHELQIIVTHTAVLS